MKKTFLYELNRLQPSQLYISQQKLKAVEKWLSIETWDGFEPLPIKLLCGKVILTDGHTRAVACKIAGAQQIPVCWDTDEVDELFYTACVQECFRQKIFGIDALISRIIPHQEYEILWYQYCTNLERHLNNIKKR